MERRIIEEYALPLKHTFDYVNEKRAKSPRRSWTDDQRLKWSLRYKRCPICQENWVKENPMTKEHIHPLVLGGFERDENIIPLCKKCNNARNDVMIDVLGSSDIKEIRRRMPAIKVAVQEFVIWCHASINLDEEALIQCHDLSEAFARQRGIPNPYDNSNTKHKEKKSIFDAIKQPFRSLISKFKTSSQVKRLNEDTNVDSKNSQVENHSEKNTQVQKAVKQKNLVKITAKTAFEENEITSFLKSSIKKRIPTKTYRSGFSASQLAYIMKQAKDHFDISWGELFNPFEVKGTIQEKSVLIVPLLGFDIEEEIGEDEKMIYKITESKLTEKTNNVSNFNLDSWLKENWKGVESYPELTKSILKFEKGRKGKNRSLRNILKEDFGIAKNRSAKNVKTDLQERYLNLKNSDKKQTKTAQASEVSKPLIPDIQDSFPLRAWLKEHWVDKNSYPSLRKSISDFESKKDNPRNLREILKEDFQIPKRWSVKQITKRMAELNSSDC